MIHRWTRGGRRLAIGLAIGGALALAAGPAAALDKVRAAESVITSLAFTGLDVGAAAKIWEEVGIDLEIVVFAGDSRMQQAFAAGEIDFGLGSGPSMAFAVKGVPAMAVASLAGPPNNMALIVAPNSRIKSAADLKGAKIGVTTAARSPTGWSRSCRASRAGDPRGSARCRWGSCARGSRR